MLSKIRGLAIGGATILASTAMTSTPAIAAVTYNLTLTGSPYSGTGSVTLNTAPVASGLSTYTSGQFSNLSFVINGQTFSTASGGTASVVQFLNGSVYDITFSQQVGTSPNRLSLQTTGGFAYYYNNLGTLETGTITSSLAVGSPVPEAATWAMMTLGFGAIGFAMRRNKVSTRIRFA